MDKMKTVQLATKLSIIKIKKRKSIFKRCWVTMEIFFLVLFIKTLSKDKGE